MESHCYIHRKSCTCHRIDICSDLSRWMCKGEHSSSSFLQFASHIYHGCPICHRSWWSHTLNCYPYSFQKPSCHISTGFHRSTAKFLIWFLYMLQSKLREALKRWNFTFFTRRNCLSHIQVGKPPPPSPQVRKFHFLWMLPKVSYQPCQKHVCLFVRYWGKHSAKPIVTYFFCRVMWFPLWFVKWILHLYVASSIKCLPVVKTFC